MRLTPLRARVLHQRARYDVRVPMRQRRRRAALEGRLLARARRSSRHGYADPVPCGRRRDLRADFGDRDDARRAARRRGDGGCGAGRLAARLQRFRVDLQGSPLLGYGPPTPSSPRSRCCAGLSSGGVPAQTIEALELPLAGREEPVALKGDWRIDEDDDTALSCASTRSRVRRRDAAHPPQVQTGPQIVAAASVHAGERVRVERSAAGATTVRARQDVSIEAQLDELLKSSASLRVRFTVAFSRARIIASISGLRASWTFRAASSRARPRPMRRRRRRGAAASAPGRGRYAGPHRWRRPIVLLAASAHDVRRLRRHNRAERRSSPLMAVDVHRRCPPLERDV